MKVDCRHKPFHDLSLLRRCSIGPAICWQRSYRPRFLMVVDSLWSVQCFQPLGYVERSPWADQTFEAIHWRSQCHSVVVCTQNGVGTTSSAFAMAYRDGRLQVCGHWNRWDRTTTRCSGRIPSNTFYLTSADMITFLLFSVLRRRGGLNKNHNAVHVSLVLGSETL